MTANTHTPGPWFNHFPSIVNEHGNSIATVEAVNPHSSKEPMANADLIAAAPDLLAALEALLAESRGLSERNPVVKQAVAAIAKAKGQA